MSGFPRVDVWLPRGGTDTFYVFDALRSTRQLLNTAGAVTDTYLYSASGDILLASGSTVNPFRFVGREGYLYDSDLAGYSLRARILIPLTARFLSRDPLFSSLLSTQLYVYADNNPIRYVDPSGKLTVKTLFKDLSPPCGGNSRIYWDFIVDAPKH